MMVASEKLSMYPHVFVAGTFDNLHRGHAAVLTRAFAEGDRVTIGLTSDEFVRMFKNGGRTYKPYEARKMSLDAWLGENGFQDRVTVIAIDDPYEPAASMDTLDALVVTRDNKGRGEEINTKRAQRGFDELVLIEVAIARAEDQKPISATRVANGEIDASGRLTLPDALRPELVKPLGEVLVGDNIGTSIEKYRNGIIVSVGDITTKTLLTAGVVPQLIIVDFRVNRKPFQELDVKLRELNLFRVRVTSGPGFIASEAIDLIKKWSTHPTDTTVMVIDGEEDLLALPAIAFGPEGSVVYYGQPKEAAWACGPTMRDGMVEVVLSKEKKNEAALLLQLFI